jgi:hypothetical protein
MGPTFPVWFFDECCDDVNGRNACRGLPFVEVAHTFGESVPRNRESSGQSIDPKGCEIEISNRFTLLLLISRTRNYRSHDLPCGMHKQYSRGDAYERQKTTRRSSPLLPPHPHGPTDDNDKQCDGSELQGKENEAQRQAVPESTTDRPSVTRASNGDQDDYPAHMTKSQTHSTLRSTTTWLSARISTDVIGESGKTGAVWAAVSGVGCRPGCRSLPLLGHDSLPDRILGYRALPKTQLQLPILAQRRKTKATSAPRAQRSSLDCVAGPRFWQIDRRCPSPHH